MKKSTIITQINIQIKHHKNELKEVELKTEVDIINCCINSLKYIRECVNKFYD